MNILKLSFAGVLCFFYFGFTPRSLALSCAIWGSKKKIQFEQTMEVIFANGSSLLNIEFSATQSRRGYESYDGNIQIRVRPTQRAESVVGETETEMGQKLYSLNTSKIGADRNPTLQLGQLTINHQNLVLVRHLETHQIFIALQDKNMTSFDHRLQIYFEIKPEGRVVVAHDGNDRPLLIDNRELQSLATLWVFDNPSRNTKFSLDLRPL